MKTIEQMYNEAKALVEDRTYQIGEISEKTGLQKTAEGWVKPKSQQGNKSKEKNTEKKAEHKPVDNWEETRMASGKIYDTPDKSYRIIERKDIDTGESTFDIRNLKNDRAEDIKGIKSLEEAKAFAEKHYGDTKENGTKENNAVKQWEESAKKDAQKYKESMVIMQHPDGSVTAIRESSPDIERAEYNGYEKISLVRPDGSVKRKQETTDNACRIAADTKIKLSKIKK